MHSIPGRRIVMALYLLFLLLPIYWLVNMSFKTNAEIVSTMTLWPHQPTLENYRTIFTDPSWYSGYINSLHYVVINTVLSISFALPAAYAFSRYRFLGDKHLFFWLLSNRMAPAAVFALPFFNLYSAIGLFDTPWAVALAHCLFNVPLAVWILEGFMSGVPREIDETAFLDGYSFPRFFVKIFMPLIASGIGVAAFFCFMFSWVELLLARTLTSVNAKPIAAMMTRTVSAAGMDWGLLAAAGVLTIIPGALVIWFVRNYIAKGFALGGCEDEMMTIAVIAGASAKQSELRLALDRFASLAMTKAGADHGSFAWMAWTWPTAIFFVALARTLGTMTWLAVAYPETERVGVLRIPTTRGDRLFMSLILAALIHLAWIAAGRHRSAAHAADRRRRRSVEPVARHGAVAALGRCDLSHGVSGEREADLGSTQD